MRSAWAGFAAPAFEAREAYRMEVEQRQKQGKLVEAARVLDEKLEEPRQALDLLAARWPDGPDAEPCRQARFTILARRGYQEQMLRLLGELRQPARSSLQVLWASRVVSVLAATSPRPEPTGSAPGGGRGAHRGRPSSARGARRLVRLIMSQLHGR